MKVRGVVLDVAPRLLYRLDKNVSASFLGRPSDGARDEERNKQGSGVGK